MATKSARDLMMALTDEDAAILHNTTSAGFPVACDMLRDDSTDYRAILDREEHRSYERVPGNGRGERPAQYINRLRAEEHMFEEMDAELRAIGVL